MTYTEKDLIGFLRYYMKWKDYLPKNLDKCLLIWKEFPDMPPIFNNPDIMKIVAEHFGITLGLFLLRTKKRHIVMPRQIYFFFLYTLYYDPESKKTTKGWSYIAECSRFNHVTIMHSCRVVKNDALIPSYRKHLDMILSEIYTQGINPEPPRQTLDELLNKVNDKKSNGTY